MHGWTDRRTDGQMDPSINPSLHHPRPHTASSSPRSGVHKPHPKLQSLLSQEWVNLCTNRPEHSKGISKHKPIKNFGQKGAWAYPGTAQIFFGTPIISGTGKAMNFKLCTHIHSISRKKSPLKI